MGFLRALARNAAGKRWRATTGFIRREFHSGGAALKNFPCRGTLFREIVGSGHRETIAISVRFSSGLALEVENPSTPASSPSNADDGADEEFNLAYTLQPEEVESSDKLLQKLFESHSHQFVGEWIGEGNKLTEPVLIKLFRKLQRVKRPAQARRLMSWVLEEKPIEITEKVNLMAIMAAQNARKPGPAEQIFNDLPEESRTTAIRTAMVLGYTRNNDAIKAEEMMASFTPKTAQAYNALITMHIRLGNFEKAALVLKRLKASGMKPNKSVLLTLIKFRTELGFEIDREEIESVLNEGIDESDCKNKLYAVKTSMLAYAYLGDEEQVERLWSMMEKVEELPTFFRAMGIEAFGILGRVEKVDELAGNVSETQRREDAFYPTLIRAYCRNGLMKKAEGVIIHVEEVEESGAEHVAKLNYFMYDEMILACLERKEEERAMEIIEEAREKVKVEWSRPSLEVVKKLLPVYGKRKDVEGAQPLVDLARRPDVSLCKQLVEIYIAAGKKAPEGLVKRIGLIADDRS